MIYLLLAIINFIAGILFFPKSSDTPGLLVSLVVSGVLIIFGIWGIILWFKLTAQAHGDKTPDREPINGWWKMVRAFDVILVLGLFFRFFIIQPFIVDGPSMEPSFHDKEAILVDKISMRLRPPVRGEVIIFQAPPQPNEDYIKRVIGLPNETVTIENGKVYINGKILNENYLPSGTLISPDEYFQTTLAKNEYFVMGDNRAHSSDSRDWGPVSTRELVGRATLVVYPLNSFEIVHNPQLSISL